MKRRNRKKAFDCAHHVFDTSLVTSDPYPMYDTEDYCKIGKYNDFTDIFELHPCETCTKFCASRPMIRKKREDDKRIRELLRRDEKCYNEVFRQGLWEQDGIDNNVIEALNEFTDF